MKLLCFLLVLVPFTVFAQAGKDSLLLADYASVKEQLELMQYLDLKANRPYIWGKEYMEKANENFEVYYRDSILAGNPTTIDISAYLGYKPGKQPKKLAKFQERAFETNAENLLRLTKTYGYICGQRVSAIKPGGILPSGLTCTLRTDTYHTKFKKLFKAEYAIGNMPESEYVFFTTMAEVQKNGIMTEADTKKMENAGIRMVKKDKL